MIHVYEFLTGNDPAEGLDMDTHSTMSESVGYRGVTISEQVKLSRISSEVNYLASTL